MKRISLALAAGSMILLGGATACSSAAAGSATPDTAAKPAVGAPAGAQSGTQQGTQDGAPEVIAAAAQVQVPPGAKRVATFHGEGVQIYGCTNGAWTLIQPAAIMSEGDKAVALHSKGPVWTSTVDGSTVAATAVPGKAVQHPDAIPELLLKADQTTGKGVFGDVTYVQRLATKGGLAPKGSCTAGQQTATPYSAEYAFWAGGN
ncbi:DUF3455 domain-containing protein [Amycolatopsis sp. FDAARGOS 1241]|uniref:DUF3455 domain-containing protein n=1 Tax=Amycolatopsis sp. FDAARGOS 1241 TaxID=2778070 RepID=UPI00194F09BA|nr:DUF3455 domain-containing protein [Amycolatopsis sp. FDAARGOS 1241]QRP44387.1 DUF3455 domain-containing protein [Amycolatopsis sp. FDAARGOS 1241]